jgi:hypothetical protein
VFIELTDHLRCPADHAEAYLVLLPGRVEQREVIAGHLGCPVCGWSTELSNGEADFGGGTPANGRTALTGEAVQAFLGLAGPGGYVALVGAATSVIGETAGLMQGTRLVAVNPPAAAAASGASVLRGGLIPLKSSSMRGTVLGADVAPKPYWVGEAVRVTLPGLRIVGEGPTPDLPELEILASGGGAWVARKAAQRI